MDFERKNVKCPIINVLNDVGVRHITTLQSRVLLIKKCHVAIFLEVISKMIDFETFRFPINDKLLKKKLGS